MFQQHVQKLLISLTREDCIPASVRYSILHPKQSAEPGLSQTVWRAANISLRRLISCFVNPLKTEAECDQISLVVDRPILGQPKSFAQP